MKRKILNFVIILFVIISLFQFSCASTETLERPDSGNLGVTKNINIDSSNRYNIINTPYVDADEKIYDFADLFTDEEEEKLYKNVRAFIEKNNIDMAIVTIDYNNKNSSMVYADDFYDYNDFGIGKNYNGILFLIDMDTRNMWISTTGSAVKIFESDIDTILDNCYSYISVDNYYDCANTFISSTQTTFSSAVFMGWVIGFIVAIVLSLLIPTIFCLVKKSKHKAIKLATHADSYLDKNSVVITNSNDVFIRTHTSRVARASSSSSGGSRHSGSSGISHGGGGRSF